MQGTLYPYDVVKAKVTSKMSNWYWEEDEKRLMK